MVPLQSKIPAAAGGLALLRIASAVGYRLDELECQNPSQVTPLLKFGMLGDEAIALLTLECLGKFRHQFWDAMAS